MSTISVRGSHCHIFPDQIPLALAALFAFTQARAPEHHLAAEALSRAQSANEEPTLFEQLWNLLWVWGWCAIPTEDWQGINALFLRNAEAEEDVLAIPLDVLAPFIKTGGWIEIEDEEGCGWRWAFEGGGATLHPIPDTASLAEAEVEALLARGAQDVSVATILQQTAAALVSSVEGSARALEVDALLLLRAAVRVALEEE
ncbi:MAG: hypothetical protein H0T73_13515 [Ardenticatenales bacterium]|nr:hypothetical protein [Ardenticatenales bacterium]